MSRLDAELQSWEATPWMPGQRVKGVGADCCGFVVAVLDAMHGTKTEIVTDTGWQMVRSLRQAWPCVETYPSGVEAGDVLVCGSTPEHFHLYILDSRGRYWHCGTAGVFYRGYPGQVRVAFRMLNKESWQ